MRTLQAGFFAGAAARMVLRGHDAARSRHGRAVVRRGHGGHQLPAGAVRPADAGGFVDRLRRHAHRRRAAARRHARRTPRRRAGTSSTRCRSIPAARGRRGRRRRCSPRSPSWAWAGRSGPATCSGPSRGSTACPTRSAGSIFGGRGTPEVPPIIIIATVSFIGVLAGLVAAVVILALVAVEQFTTGFTNDALLIKNLTFYFGHMLVNITMYFGVAMVYEIMPAYTGPAVEDQRAGRGVVEPRAAAGDVRLPAPSLHGLRAAAVAAGCRPGVVLPDLGAGRGRDDLQHAGAGVRREHALEAAVRCCSISASWAGRSAASRP